MQIDNIEDLFGGAEEAEKKDEDETGAENVDGEGKGDDTAVDDGKKAQKAEPWFDRDRQINAAHKFLTKKCDVQKASHAKGIRELEEALASIDHLDASEREHFRGERCIAVTRLTMMKKLLDSSEDVIEHINTFKSQVRPSHLQHACRICNSNLTAWRIPPGLYTFRASITVWVVAQPQGIQSLGL